MSSAPPAGAPPAAALTTGVQVTAPLVSVVIVSYRSAASLPECVAAALDSGVPVEVLVVDNAPGDGSVAAVRAALAGRESSRVGAVGCWRVIDSPGNPGFARACNLGASQAQGEWLLLLNPDCCLVHGCLPQLVEEAEQLPRLGLLGVLLVDREGSLESASLRRDPTPQRAIVAALGGSRLARALGRPELALSIPPPPVPGLVEVDALSGALMLLRRHRYEALGGLDEGYFLHCEDLDLCRRARLAGWHNYVDTRLRLIHWKGVSSASRPLSVAWHKHRGMLRYYRRFDRPSTPWWLHAAVLFGAWSRILLKSPWLALRQWLGSSG